MNIPNATTMPPAHREFLEQAVTVLGRDKRIAGIAVAGSLAEGGADEFSDVDLVVAVEPEAHPSVMADRHRLAAAMGTLAGAFTGEHVGEPRLLICLYDNPVLHVDLKFLPLPDALPVVDNPGVVWARDGRLEAVLRERVGAYPPPDRQWLEDRFWIWVHYLAGKIARGELFEAMEGLSFLRVTVLAPLGLESA
ncbi:MAG: nucleotidyltransferase domain-containing protein, partial [Planctomycetes bacterium]|nr:nucleotidyltransferase domain-containing protein [Planctomycetota bacterium]